MTDNEPGDIVKFIQIIRNIEDDQIVAIKDVTHEDHKFSQEP